MNQISDRVRTETLLTAFRHLSTAKQLAELYEEHFKTVSKYVHATSRGHEAIQVAAGMLLRPQDYAAPYYRDDAMLLAMGVTPHELMLQLLARRDDVFSGGRTYYSHPSLRDDDRPTLPHQSSATGMQAIPTTGVALGLQYRERQGLTDHPAYRQPEAPPVVLCSLGDASVTEGEVAEAFQMAALRQLPILYLVQDNGWDISASADEVRAQNAAEYARGFRGLAVRSIDGSDFVQCFETLREVVDTIRRERRPFLVHASVPLLNHHTSGVRKEWYRDDLDEHALRDPYPFLRSQLLESGVSESELDALETDIRRTLDADYQRALAAPEPTAADLATHIFAPTSVVEERGDRRPAGAADTVMVDSALSAMEETLRTYPEALLYGQDVGGRLGGVFREAATLAQKFGDERVFNTPIQEAFIIGSTVGMSAVGLKPIVEVQFADYIWPGLNQLFTEVSRSNYLSNGKFPVNMTLRVPIGAYGSGGPYHSSSVESVVTNIRGLKIAYPSNGADLKGLLKAAVQDPNPCVIFEHKGLYWSKVRGTESARTPLPDAEYVLPFGRAAINTEADADQVSAGRSGLVVTYGMGVHWARRAARSFDGAVEILDLRTLFPLDEALVFERVRRHGRVLVLTEEPIHNGFAQALAGRIAEHCFRDLDAPVMTLGSAETPAIPLNEHLERAYLPSAEEVVEKLRTLLDF